MLPKMLIGCSAKSYLTLDAGRRWAEQVANELREKDLSGEGVYICPPFPLIPLFLELLEGSGVAVGTQDVSMYPPGPYTGEVSAPLLAELGVRYVMTGHPERRRLFGEGPREFNRKVLVTAEVGMVPILVVGEPERIGNPGPVLREQVQAALRDFPAAADLVVAYEPTWAIGQAEPASGDHVVATIARLREIIADFASQTRILYGGSAKLGTYGDIGAAAGAHLAGLPDGIFLGRGGLEAVSFVQTIEEVRRTGATVRASVSTSRP